MVVVIGKENCSRCDIVKGILEQKNINFEYRLLESLEEDYKNKILNMAKEKNQNSFPLIIKNDEIVTLQEVN